MPNDLVDAQHDGKTYNLSQDALTEEVLARFENSGSERFKEVMQSLVHVQATSWGIDR